jgi:hypothetical protein
MVHCQPRLKSCLFEPRFSELLIVSRIDLQETFKMTSRSCLERFEVDRFFYKHTPFGTDRRFAASTRDGRPSK